MFDFPVFDFPVFDAKGLVMFPNERGRPDRPEALRATPRRALCNVLFVAGLLSACDAMAQESPRWTLTDALTRALDESPVLRARQASLQEAAGRRLGATVYPYNPEVEIEVAGRSGPDGSTTDRGLSVSQELELAGQRRRRIEVADRELASAEAGLDRDRQRLAAAVETAFAEAVRARELLAVAEIDATLAREMSAFSRRRLERGATTQIEVNLAQASAGRAERGVQRAQADYAATRARLATVAGANPGDLPEPVGELSLPADESRPLDELIAEALERRADLRGFELEELAAEAAVRLAIAEGRPNLVVGGFYQREEATDDIVGATVGFSVPLFDRNQGRIAERRATRQRLDHQKEALRLAIEQEVVTASSALRAARASAEFLRHQVLGTLEENVDLLQRSFAAGRIGAAEVVTLRREFVDSRRETVEALTDAWLARIALDLAVGRGSHPEALSGKERS